MSENQSSPKEEKVACDVCLKEVPVSSAKNEEVQDYVAHFCGIDCFAIWKEKHNQEENQ